MDVYDLLAKVEESIYGRDEEIKKLTNSLVGLGHELIVANKRIGELRDEVEFLKGDL